MHLSIDMYICIFINRYIYIWLYIYLSIYRSIYLYIYIYIYTYIYIYQWLYLSTPYLSVYLSIYLCMDFLEVRRWSRCISERFGASRGNVYVFLSVSALRAPTCVYRWAFRRFAPNAVCAPTCLHLLRWRDKGWLHGNMGIRKSMAWAYRFFRSTDRRISQIYHFFIAERRCAAEFN